MTAAAATEQRYVITESEHKGRPVMHVHSTDRDRDWIAAASRGDDAQWYVMLGLDAARTAGYIDIRDHPPGLYTHDRAQARAALEMFARLYFAQPRAAGTPL
ncbi:hypothetical protein FZI85_25310 [Mycobacterium sp. CBMA293]|uniref:hypothetical protein n=1 Tax=unclassified Mycolicibacterium TaxID=2636767 RepID=UPI0012DC98AE|nr:MULTISPECIES: hypothetical protein [unclassified Mycolicibacterium]MUL47634.1 hypothetical protein [Mycolicibacterium sp. CBMA 360]MUL61848.1 hypothetical protein [Mycolicibacterium sp. CBMA 335]MUL68921.1 hypothetical protein [Mycolicibacterium sp. CBMA 311]MUL92862.1 hypothetical protein [Mycolicibacterium sp. CBMA 230]MUM08696.1 hypothetical protein [Mycolicibacterium sp. CBMA 213]